jgi:uncharacterized protein (UPF0335 family)
MSNNLALINKEERNLTTQIERLNQTLSNIFLPKKLTNTEFISHFDSKIQRDIINHYIKKKIRKSCKQK